MIDPFSATNDAGSSEYFKRLTALMKRTLGEENSGNTSIKRFRDSWHTDSIKRSKKGVIKSYKVRNLLFF